MESRRLTFLSVVALLAGVAFFGRFDSRLSAAVQPEIAPPEWFSNFNSDAPPLWNDLNPVHPFPPGNWEFFIAAAGSICPTDANLGTSSPFQPYGPAFRGPLTMGYGVFSNSSGDSQTVMFVGTGAGSDRPLTAFVPGPPHVSLGDFGHLEGADIAGAVVASGNFSADGTNELVATTPGPGVPSAVHVLNPGRDDVIKVFPFGEQYDGGLSVTTGNFDGLGFDEFAVGQAQNGSRVRVYGMRGSDVVLLGDGFPLGQNHTGGVNLEAFDLNNDGGHELIVSPNRGAPRVLGYGFKIAENDTPRPTNRLFFSYSFFEDTRLNGVRIAAGVRDNRVAIAATTDDIVSLFTMDPGNQAFTRTASAMPFGRNVTPINVRTTPPRPGQ